MKDDHRVRVTVELWQGRGDEEKLLAREHRDLGFVAGSMGTLPIVTVVEAIRHAFALAYMAVLRQFVMIEEIKSEG